MKTRMPGRELRELKEIRTEAVGTLKDYGDDKYMETLSPSPLPHTFSLSFLANIPDQLDSVPGPSGSPSPSQTAWQNSMGDSWSRSRVLKPG